jgi:hypothetical protein
MPKTAGNRRLDRPGGARDTAGAMPREASPGPASPPGRARLYAIGSWIRRGRRSNPPPAAAEQQQPGPGARSGTQPPKPVQAAAFLKLVREALRDGKASLSAAPPGPPAPPGDIAAQCGWTGGPRPPGPCIGFISGVDGRYRRVHLFPPLAYEAAAAAAARRGASLPLSLPQVSDALRESGLAVYGTGDGTSRPRPGSPWLFWHMPASTLLTRVPGRLPKSHQAAGHEPALE